MTKKEKCPCCMGEGFVLISSKENVEERLCSECDGAGVMWCDECDGEGCEACEYMGVEGDCPSCKGNGTSLNRVIHSEPPFEEVLTFGQITSLLIKKIFKK